MYRPLFTLKVNEDLGCHKMGWAVSKMTQKHYKGFEKKSI